LAHLAARGSPPELTEVAYTIFGYYSDGSAPFDLRDHPPGLPYELGRALAEAAGGLARVLRSGGDADPGLPTEAGLANPDEGAVKAATALTRLAELMSRLPENYDALAETEVTSQVAAIAVIALSAQARVGDPASGRAAFLELMLGYVMPYIERVFEPHSAWLQSPSHAPMHDEPVLADELHILDGLIDRCCKGRQEPGWAASPQRQQLETVLLVLNAWMRCSGGLNDLSVENLKFVPLSGVVVWEFQNLREWAAPPRLTSPI
jgi:hypothetical protein